MDYLDFGDNIDYNKYNALVYLLRKFKKLTSNLTLGAYKLESDYGTFNFSDGFVNVGNNWILENPVTVTSNDVLKNTFYTFNFVVIDVNTTGTVNRRIVSVTEGTSETGTLELTIPSDLIGTDEVILPNFTLEVVFDEHEYYTQLPDVHLVLSVDKMGIREGEVATITGLLTDSTSTPIENVSLPLNVDGTTVTVITDSTGEFNYAYTGTGTRGKVFVSALGESVFFYDGLIDIVGATVTGNNVSLGVRGSWLFTQGDVTIFWGDGTSDIVNNPQRTLSHTYADGLNEHLIIFDGTVTTLGTGVFLDCSGLTSITIPDSVTSIGVRCFNGCSGLTSVVIPDSVTSMGFRCFYECTSLVDYDLYWESNPVSYVRDNMPANTDTVFNIPAGTMQAYITAGYPSDKLRERGSHNYNLSITADKDIISSTEVATLTATLSDNSTPVSGETLNYQIKHGNTVIDSGMKTTDSNGEATISYTGSGVGDVDIVVEYGTLLQETFVVEDCLKYYQLTDNTHESAFTIPSGVVSSYSSDGWNISATNYSMVKLTDKLTNDCSVEFTLEDYNKLPSGDSVLVYQYSNGETMPNQEIITSGNTDNFPLILGQRMNHDLIRGAKYKIEYTSSTIKVYENNILLASASNTVGFPTRFEWHMGSGGRYAVYKDLKVKAL